LTVIEEVDKSEDIDTDIDMTKDTISIILNEVDSMEHITDKDKLKNMIKEIYLESISQ
jgi:hypothetical protein